MIGSAGIWSPHNSKFVAAEFVFANVQLAATVLRIAFCFADVFDLLQSRRRIEGWTVGIDLTEQDVDVMVSIALATIGGSKLPARLTHRKSYRERTIESGTGGAQGLLSTANAAERAIGGERTRIGTPAAHGGVREARAPVRLSES